MTRRRRILFVDHTAVLGGGEIALLNLVRHLDRSRFIPTVLLCSEGPLVEKLRQAGIPTHIIPLAPSIIHTRKGNIGFGLKMAGLPRDEISRKVEAAAATLNLTAYLDRKPRELSGGQRQRVAIGRAIVREPKAFLFDEPLSNLDAALRVQMRLEITTLQKQLATTAVYVTHDQVEAMTMADRIVVLNAGRIEQFGSPLELYDRPANLFVAGFIGSPRMNLIGQEAAQRYGAETIGIRPEHLRAARDGEGWQGRVAVAEHLGSDTFLHVDVPGVGNLTARSIGELGLTTGDDVRLLPDPGRIHRFDRDGKTMSK